MNAKILVFWATYCQSEGVQPQVINHYVVVQEEDCKRMVDTAIDSFGGLHVAFNNHGILWFGHYTTTSEEDVTKTLDINLKSLVFCFKYQVRVKI